MRIAYLILCHRDPRHVARLSLKLTAEDRDCTVFIHVDRKSDMADTLAHLVRASPRVVFTARRIDVYWCGYSEVEATYELLRTSYGHGTFDRFVILQGADYPLKSPAAIRSVFARHRDREFIRACDTTIAETRYLRCKPRYVMFLDRPNLLKRIANRLTRMLDLRLRGGSIEVHGQDWHVYWGSAQIAFTRALADVFLAFENDPRLKRFFRTCFAAEETYFHTIAFNSDFRSRTTDGSPVPETRSIRLVDTRSICYFEYPKLVTVFAEQDFERLRSVDALFIRKVDTDTSGGLLDRIDAMHALPSRTELQA